MILFIILFKSPVQPRISPFHIEILHPITKSFIGKNFVNNLAVLFYPAN